MNATINVILPTYNGEPYIVRQLETLAAQTYDTLHVFLRDDGSSDHTVEKIQTFIDRYQGPKQFTLLPSDGINLGVPGAFYHILRHCTPAPYYALCDQDDEWYPQKTEWAMEKLTGEENAGRGASAEIPLIYYSRCDYKDEQGNLLRESPHQEAHPPLHKVLYHTPASGFTCVFNEALRRKMVLEHTPGDELQDRYLIRGAVCFGKTVYDDRKTAAHIRHASAVTSGDADNRSLFRNFLEKELQGSAPLKEKKGLQHFYEEFRDELTEADKNELRLFAADATGLPLRLQKLFYRKRLRTRLAGEAALRLLFLTGKI